ncbi:MFS transporter [Pararhizobium mangrovi]|uniref:MFS transporter n=1 Tax=Pararhizobium mangrovi TaxID=2590452 RepID=A0A506U1W7_9HYPH|nr:MFS transporter [Pararhizobium mangrovi]TPW27760.1 MFS transporter [Pararhizobium mangrovi]
MPASPSVSVERFAAFGHRSYRYYFASRFFETFAMEVVVVAVGWQVYDLTLVTGSAADRFGRRAIMSACEGVSLVCAGLLTIITALDDASVPAIFAVLVALGIARAFFGPAAQSLAPNLVPEEDVPNAVAWNSSAWQVASIVGPVVGGLLYGFGARVPYALALVLFVAASLSILMVASPPQRFTKEPQSWRTLSAGFRHIWEEKIVLGAVSLDMVAVLLGGAVALMPVFARDILHLGPWGLGMLRAGPGIGAVAMAALLAARPIRNGAGKAMLLGVAIFGLGTIVFGLSRTPWLSVVALIAMGAADMISVYVRQTLIQLWTPDQLRGRVSAVNMVFIGASNELGEFRAGGMAALIGTVPTVVLGGVGTLIVTALWGRLFPAMRKVENLIPPERAEA